MRIERGDVDDLGRIVDLWVDLAGEMREYGARVRPDESREAIRERLAHALVADRVHVVREDGRILGFLSHRTDGDGLSTDGTRAIITYGYVVPDRRGEGIGTELFQTAHEDLAAAGHDAVALEVMADNDAARRLYRRLGYDPHRIRMAKPLDPPESDNHSKDDA